MRYRLVSGARRRGAVSAVILMAVGAVALGPIGTPAARAQSTAAPAAMTVVDLMQLLARKKRARASFAERKYVAILDRPVESSGELRFEAPDRLEKRTLRPKPETLLLTGGNLTIEQGKRRRTIALEQYPDAAPFIDSVRATLAGDLAALERFWRVGFSGADGAWTLQLRPVAASAATVISEIRMSGRHDDIRSIEVIQADGDRSVMQIEQLPLDDDAPSAAAPASPPASAPVTPVTR